MPTSCNNAGISLIFNSVVTHNSVAQVTGRLQDAETICNRSVELRVALKQRRGEMSYEDRCKILKWNTLEKRREFLSLVECYKTVFGLNGISFEEVFEYKQYRATRTNHAYILFILNDQESIALNILFW